MQYSIITNKLSAGYATIPVFKELDLNIPTGSITTLIGSNGSGKSTILKTMSRIIKPYNGNVYLEGKLIHNMSTKMVAKKLALLSQNTETPSNITVRDLVEYGRFPYLPKFGGIKKKDHEIIDWALECTNMSELAGREMDKLSGGQRQRAWIAMTLAQKTSILFLDEPTTYLDISHQLEILELIKKLNAEQGVTVVMVLHDLNHAIMFSDYLVVIKDGEKHCEGKPEDVINPKMIRDVFKVESEVIIHPVLGVPICLPYSVSMSNKKS